MMDTEHDPVDGAAVEADDDLDRQIPSPDTNPDWRGLLGYLRERRGFDFHGYKPASLARRIRKRMGAVKVEDYGQYQSYLESHPPEFAALFNTILINVTGFFRDPEAWEVVRTQAIPTILETKAPEEPIRVWSAGCASGEEAYTIAMLLAEELPPDGFSKRVKIYATDIDEEALNVARQAAYNNRQIEGVPGPLLGKYFEQVDELYFFRKDLRRQVIFGRHDLIHDAPISRIDLLTCRNMLMYLNAETQARVLARLHFALNEGGYLLLGRAETLMTHTQTFGPVDLKRRLSRKVARGGQRVRAFPREERPAMDQSTNLEGRMQAAALELSPVAQLMVDAAGTVTLLNDRARTLFDLRPNDVGRPLRDLQLSYRPVELRSLIEKAEVERRPVVVREIEWTSRAGETRFLDLSIAPVLNVSAVIGTAITFTDVTAYRRLQRELEHSHNELENAYEELQSTNEELETTNEELQSTVEELETTNEELQSTNEELETMNEELQSTNEELETMNDELRQRGDALDSANSFLESVLTSLKGGVAVVDRDFNVLAWNSRAEDLWGLRASEVSGQHFLNLDMGLPVDRLKPVLKSCFGGEADGGTILLDAVNRRGKPICCEVTCTPLLGSEEEVLGAIVLMEEAGDGKD
jgi:two-component system, chemotaxis family, CheB/CheR fusion protein